jgi:hypothetical protein
MLIKKPLTLVYELIIFSISVYTEFNLGFFLKIFVFRSFLRIEIPKK